MPAAAESGAAPPYAGAFNDDLLPRDTGSIDHAIPFGDVELETTENLVWRGAARVDLEFG